MKALNNRGFAHFAALAIIVLAVGIAGTYKAVASHANSLSQSYACADTRPQLSKGQTSECVKTVQTKLGVKPVDGIFGEVTQAKVKAFQGKYHLKVDGIVGPCTWAQLIDGKTAASCKTGGVADQAGNKPKPVDISKIYCTYTDGDKKFYADEQMSRTQCKALHGRAATTIACGYIGVNKKPSTVRAKDTADCSKKKLSLSGGICTRKQNGTVTSTKPTIQKTCASYKANSLLGAGTWVAF